MTPIEKKNSRYSDLVSNVRDYIRTLYKNSEHLYTTASPWGQLLDVIQRLLQFNLFYIEDSVTELNINSAQKANSIYGLARLAGYDPMRATAAMGTITINPNGMKPEKMSGNYVIIPNFSQLKCDTNGLEYVAIYGQSDLKVDIYSDRSTKYMKLIQGRFEQQTFTGTGANLQSFEANQINKNIVDHHNVQVYVNGERWTKYDSLIDIPRNSKGFLVKTGLTSGLDVFFGNKTHGAIPELGSKIIVQYILTEGNSGNITDPSSYSFKFLNDGYDIEGSIIDLNKIFTLKVVNPVLFGAPSEEVQLTKLLAPLQSRSFVFGQTSNYRQYFEQMQRFSKIKVWTETNKFDPYIDQVVFAMLLPDISKLYKSGEDYFSIQFNKFAITESEKFAIQQRIEESGSMILGSVLSFEDPTFNRYMLNIYMNIFQGYDKKKIQDEIKIKLSQYFTQFKRDDYMPKSDLIAIIEAVTGVDSVSVEFLSEDVENELRILTDYDNYLNSKIPMTDLDKEKIMRFYENWSWYENNPDVFAYGEYLQSDLNMPETLEDMNINKKLKFLFSLTAIQNYIKKFIDINGDLVLSTTQIPLIRGDWYDRYGRLVNDEVGMKSLNCVNFYYRKENSDYLNYYGNKKLISTLRNNLIN